MSLDQATGVTDDLTDADGSDDAGIAAAPRGRGRGSRRRDRPRARRRRGLLVVVTGGLAAVAVLWIGWASPLTVVEHVVVSAPSGISEKAVRKASGIAATDHVPAVDAALVRSNVMAALPAVGAVAVRRSLPDTISLTVTARLPFAVIPRGDRYAVIDSAGVEFDHTRSPGQLPVILARSYEGGRSARAALESLPPDLLAELRTIGASTHHDIDLTLVDGAKVRWGSPDDAELKAQVLRGLRSVKAAHYDVSAPLMPTTSG